MAKKLEEHLYRSARTKEEYVDPATLKFRLHLIAKGGGISKPEEEEDVVEAGDDRSGGGGGSVISRSSSGVQSFGLGIGRDVSSNTHSLSSFIDNNKQAKSGEHVSVGQGNFSSMAGIVGLHLSLSPPQQMRSQADRRQELQHSKEGQTLSGSPIAPANDSNFVSIAHDSSAPRQKMTEVNVIQQQRRLLLLRHSSKCTSGPSCHMQHCPQMVILWKHLKKCRDTSCKVSHCLSSKCVLNHYRKCQREGDTASCAICGPVVNHARQIDEERITRNEASGRGEDDMGADEFDTIVFSSQSQELTDSFDDMGSFHGDINIDSAVDDLFDCETTQLNNIEPIDAFPTRERNTMPKSISDDRQIIPAGGPITQDLGMPTSALHLPRNIDITQEQARKAGTMADFQAQTQVQVKNDSGSSAQELQKELDQKQLLSQLIQQQKVMICVYEIISFSPTFPHHSPYLHRQTFSARIENCNKSLRLPLICNRRNICRKSRLFASSYTHSIISSN